jgi:hypothetical protein
MRLRPPMLVAASFTIGLLLVVVSPWSHSASAEDSIHTRSQIHSPEGRGGISQPVAKPHATALRARPVRHYTKQPHQYWHPAQQYHHWQEH